MRPLTDDVLRWLEERTADDAQWSAGALVVWSRDLQPLVEGLFEEGFAIPPGDGQMRISAP